jgi:hypothetical protein
VPPLDGCPATIEVVVTGPAARLHASVPVRGIRGEAHT